MTDIRILEVRNALRWGLSLLLEYEAESTRVPLPRLAQVQLGDLMVRTDPETLYALAADIGTEEEIGAHIYRIRSAWGEEPRARVRRGTREAQVEIAILLRDALHRHCRGETRRLLEQGSTMPSFRALEQHWPGRVWTSLRDDYDRLAIGFYRSEKNIICAASSVAVKVGRLRKVRR